MANATDTRDAVIQGFEELIASLEESQGWVSAERAAEIAQAARQRAEARVRAEYLHLGLEPPSPLALSITALMELGLPTPDPVQLHDGWMEAGE